MPDLLRIDDIRFTPSARSGRETNCYGFARCRVDGRWEFDSLRVIETADGRIALSFPTRVDGNGVEHPYFRPLDQATRDEIERAVIGELRRRRLIP